MLLRLAPLICLIAATAAQQTIYCDSFAGTIRLSDFYLATLKQSDSSFPPGLTCDFSAETGMAAFLVEIETFSVTSATLTISSGSTTLFTSSGPNPDGYRKAIVTPSKSLRVRFDARGDYSYGRGVTMRVRTFDNNGCPANWQYLYGNCFGTSSATGRLNYIDAQRACNSMRANLLHIPSSHTGSIGAFMRMLPSSLRSSYTWIGLTDRGTQYRPYWLNNNRQYSTSDISCVSGGSYYTCYSSERCAAFNDKNYFYAIYMDSCSDRDYYACSMPPGGTTNFYSVPNIGSGIIFTDYLSTTVIWAIVMGCLAFAGFVIGAIYFAVRQNYIRRNAGAGVVVTAGRVIIPPPVGSYPTQQQYPAQPQQYPAQPQQYPAQQPQYSAAYYPPPQVSGPSPPDYSAAVGSGGGGLGGNQNMGYVK